MKRMRSLSFPKLSVAQRQEDSSTMANGAPPTPTSPSHSRDSSAASTTSSPVTATFSARGHSRWPSSTSSLATTPDSPANVGKSSLHDLVEDPAEREDDSIDDSGYYGIDNDGDEGDDELCICDTPFCKHRKASTTQPSTPIVAPEWMPGDDALEDGELPTSEGPRKRRTSGQFSGNSIGRRLSRRMPSISKRWSGHYRRGSGSAPVVHSAPTSRAASVAGDHYFAGPLTPSSDIRGSMTPTLVAYARHSDDDILSAPIARSPGIPVPPTPQDEPIDRHELARTPLLPPVMDERRGPSTEEIRSPLQSPTVAGPGNTLSATSTPALTPILPNMPTPPLSSKPSAGSMRGGRFGPLTPDVPPMVISDEQDYWAAKLGHANFNIYPEPYYPTVCDAQSCQRLLSDWEAARMEFLRQAARVGEHYGPTSQTFKLTEEKWAEIDAQWRSFHESATNHARAIGENPSLQSLADPQPLSKMPSLEDPQHQGKFPKLEKSDIVGPMVQYAKIQRGPSRRASILRIFTDPASLLGRTPFGLRSR